MTSERPTSSLKCALVQLVPMAHMQFFRKLMGAVLAIVAVGGLGGCAGPVQSSQAPELLWAGIYEGTTTKSFPDSRLVGGRYSWVEDIKHLQRTNIVPAKRGTRFGIEFTIPGATSNNEVTYTKMWHFPKPGLLDPAFGGKRAIAMKRKVLAIDGEQHAGWHFSEDWEVVPGEWKLQILIEDKVVIEQVFEVR